MDDDLRQAVIESIISGPPEKVEAASEKVSEITEDVEESVKDTKPKVKYDLNNALNEVLEKKNELAKEPEVIEEERKACGVRMDKKLLHELMGNFRR